MPMAPEEHQACKTCRFIVDYCGVYEDEGFCHRYPPAVVQGLLEENEDLRQPTVYGSDWCGEWQPRTTHQGNSDWRQRG